MAADTVCSDFGAQENKTCHCFHFFPIYLPWSDGTGCHDLSFLNAEFWFFFECRVLKQPFTSPLSPSSRGSGCWAFNKLTLEVTHAQTFCSCLQSAGFGGWWQGKAKSCHFLIHKCIEKQYCHQNYIEGEEQRMDSKEEGHHSTYPMSYILMCLVAQVASDSLRPCGLWPARLLCPWNLPGKSRLPFPTPGNVPDPGTWVQPLVLELRLHMPQDN